MESRRGFLSKLALGLTAFTILPGAGRIWKASNKVIVPSCFESPYFKFLPGFQDFIIETQYHPEWKIWDNLLNQTSWKPNMGSTTHAILVEPEPIRKREIFSLT